MTGILDQISTSRASFRVRSLDDVFAIQLARALGDLQNVHQYLRLTPLYPLTTLAGVARQLTREATSGPSTFEAFQAKLTPDALGSGPSWPTVIGLRTERACVGLAVIGEVRVVHLEARQLRAEEDDAARSIAALVRRNCADTPAATVAVEQVVAAETRRDRLVKGAEETARELAMPIWKVSRAELFSAYALPSCATREELRSIAASLFPELPTGRVKPQELDAAAIGMLAAIGILLNLEEKWYSA